LDGYLQHFQLQKMITTPDNLPAPTPLSPAAQAVLDAAFSVYDCEALYSLTEGQHAGMIAAAALRAAADQMSCYQSKKFLYSIADAMKLRAIATELENQP
jgi:hypothetical protein